MGGMASKTRTVLCMDAQANTPAFLRDELQRSADSRRYRIALIMPRARAARPVEKKFSIRILYHYRQADFNRI
jgi:hypothetical protein